MTTDNKLPEEFKRKWLEALRSGRYTQCRSGVLTSMRDGRPTYCCIAVAAKEYNQPIKDETTYKWLAEFIGMSNVDELWNMNDGNRCR